MTGSGSIGLLFPPSLPLIVYGMVYGMTAGQLARDESGGGAALPNFDIDRFLVAGILPGIVLIGIVSLYASYVGVKHKVPRTPFKGKDALKALWGAEKTSYTKQKTFSVAKKISCFAHKTFSGAEKINYLGY